jgi:hypothetical protein
MTEAIKNYSQNVSDASTFLPFALMAASACVINGWSASTISKKEASTGSDSKNFNTKERQNVDCTFRNLSARKDELFNRNHYKGSPAPINFLFKLFVC